MKFMRLMSLVVVLPMLTACFPLVLPPVQTRISGGPTLQSNPQPVVEWRAGLHPAQLLPDQLKRPWVLGVGYLGRHVGLLGLGQGIYAEVGYAHVRRLKKDSIRRVSLTIAPEMLYRAGYSAWGYGATAALGVEWVGQVHTGGGMNSQAIFGGAHGEAGLGFSLSGGFESVDDRDVGFVLVGLRLSVPAFAGLIFAPDMLVGALRNL